MSKNTFTHGKKVAAALALLQSGQAETKQQAAALVGLHHSSLTPGKVAGTLERNPEVRAHLVTAASLMEITIEKGGRSITAREIFSTGCKAALDTLEEHAARTGKTTPAQRARVREAQAWLKMSKDFGLFRDDGPGTSAPAEIGAAVEREGSAAWFLRNHARTDGKRAAETLTIPGATQAKPSQDEGAE